MTASLTLALALGLAPTADPAPAPAKGVKKVSAAFEPAEARPGQTVTFKLTVELEDGYHTYPAVQTDPQAAGMVNEIKFPAAGAVVFVGKTADPLGAKTKAEPALGITEMRYYEKAVVYERKAVVMPDAKPGDAAVKLPAFKLSVCDKDNCFPPKTLTPEATLKVLSGPPVPVEKAFADEVRKAGK